MDFLSLIEAHDWDKQDLLLQRWHSTIYREFPEGFVMLVPGEDFDILVATSEGDNHSMDMWRVIRSILKTRTRAVITQYERNFDKLFKASKRYGGIALSDGIVIFP